jgi:3'(2'),5'-bisphosphate nucleotidase
MIEAALEAGAEIEALYGAGCAAETKQDGSPVTEADRRAEAIILRRLRGAYPDIPILAEEEACDGCFPDLGTRFFLVDALDGTRGFIERNGEFTVNVALIDEGIPVAGVVYAPDSRALYYGAAGEGAYRRLGTGPEERIQPRPHPPQGLTAIVSRGHAADIGETTAHLGVAELLPSSSSLKFCLLAEGSADVYPRYGPTMEWDTGAGQAVLEAAGGRVMALSGPNEIGRLNYGKLDCRFENPHFIAWGV